MSTFGIPATMTLGQHEHQMTETQVEQLPLWHMFRYKINLHWLSVSFGIFPASTQFMPVCVF